MEHIPKSNIMCILPVEVMEVIASACDDITRYRLCVALKMEDAALAALEDVSTTNVIQSGAMDVLTALWEAWTRYKVPVPEEVYSELRFASGICDPRTLEAICRILEIPIPCTVLIRCGTVESAAWVVKKIRPKKEEIKRAWRAYASRGHTELLRFLRTVRPKFMPSGEEAKIMLGYTIVCGHKECAEYIWAEFCPNEPAASFLLSIKNAAQRGHSEIVRWFFRGRRELWKQSIFEAVVNGCPLETVEWAWRQGRGRLRRPSPERALSCTYAESAGWVIEAASPSVVVTADGSFELRAVYLCNLNILHEAKILELGRDFLDHAMRQRRMDIIEWLYSKRGDFTSIDWAEQYERRLLTGEVYFCNVVPFLHGQGIRPKRDIRVEVQQRFASESSLSLPVLKLVCEEYGVVFLPSGHILQRRIELVGFDRPSIEYLARRFNLKFPVSFYIRALANTVDYSGEDLDFIRRHLERVPARSDDKRVFSSFTPSLYSLREARFYERLWAN